MIRAITALLLLSPFLVFSQQVKVNLLTEKRDITTIDREMERFIKKYRLLGATFVIAHKGRIVYSCSYGNADSAKRVKLTPDHRFPIRRASRNVTAIAIMKLLQEGKVSLEDTVFGLNSIFAKEFPVIKNKYLAELTVKNLLEMNTFQSWYKEDQLERMSPNDHLFNLGTIITLTNDKKKPGTTHWKSDYPYYVLGRIIEKLSGKTYLEYIKEMGADIFVNGISVCGDKDKKMMIDPFGPQRPGFRRFSVEAEQYDSCKGIVCSPHDLMTLFLSADGLPATRDILQNQAVKIMFSPTNTGDYYAKGWRIDHNGKYYLNSRGRYSVLNFHHDSNGVSWMIATHGQASASSFYENSESVPKKIISRIKKLP